MHRLRGGGRSALAIDRSRVQARGCSHRGAVSLPWTDAMATVSMLICAVICAFVISVPAHFACGCKPGHHHPPACCHAARTHGQTASQRETASAAVRRIAASAQGIYASPPNIARSHGPNNSAHHPAPRSRQCRGPAARGDGERGRGGRPQRRAHDRHGAELRQRGGHRRRPAPERPRRRFRVVQGRPLHAEPGRTRGDACGAR